jgi:hypothetical protein
MGGVPWPQLAEVRATFSSLDVLSRPRLWLANINGSSVEASQHVLGRCRPAAALHLPDEAAHECTLG